MTKSIDRGVLDVLLGRIPTVCHICGVAHYNACPRLWGGTPELPAESKQSLPIRERIKLTKGTLVEVVDPNYRTRVVGTLREERWTGVYYEPVIILVGNGRTAACGYISRKEI